MILFFISTSFFSSFIFVSFLIISIICSVCNLAELMFFENFSKKEEMLNIYLFIGITRYKNDLSPTPLTTIGLLLPEKLKDMLSESMDWKQSIMYL